MQIFSKTGTFEKLVTKELELTARRQSATAALKAAESAAANALLEGDAGTEMESTTRLGVEISTIDSALRLLRANRLDALRAKRSQGAVELRNAAAVKQSELDSITAKAMKSLGDLSRLLGVPYTVHILWQEPNEANGPAGLHCPLLGPLQDNIADLKRQASILEEMHVPARGEVDQAGLTDLAGVLPAVLGHESDSPSAADIYAWADLALVKARKHAAYQDALPRRVRIVWNAGVIDLEQSTIYVADLVRMVEPTQASGIAAPYADPKSALFRAA